MTSVVVYFDFPDKNPERDEQFADGFQDFLDNTDCDDCDVGDGYASVELSGGSYIEVREFVDMMKEKIVKAGAFVQEVCID
jgi:hypothetical protein